MNKPTIAARLRSAAAWAWRRRWIRVYLILLAASHLVIAVFAPDVWTGRRLPPPTERGHVETTPMRASGPAPRGEVRLAYLRWTPPRADPAKPPVLLLHGSPAQGALDWRHFAPRLAAAGYEVIALDRPGFGASDKWVPDYSIRAGARYAFALLDALGIERAHVVGWSLSGGVAIHMADMAPERLASLTMLSAIGVQEGEGSGSYYFEHAKYAFGYAALVVLPELIPHFNLIGDRGLRHAFIRDFWDSDQRPLRAILEQIRIPTLILHGRRDPLIPAWVAEEHHDIVGPSRLVMLDASHFFVFGPPMDDDEHLGAAADALLSFLDRHDGPGVIVRRAYVDLAPAEAIDRSIGGVEIDRDAPWWLVVLIIMLGTKVSEDLTVIAVGLLVSAGQIDLGVGFLGCCLGIFVGDMALWAVGRFVGKGLLNIPFFRKRLPERSLNRWSDMLERHTVKAVFLSRMIPGTRLPMYVAAGMLGRRPYVFIGWFAVAVLIWTPVLLGLTMLVGPPVLDFFENVFQGPLALIASIVFVLAIIRLISYESTGQGRARLKADLKRLYRHEFWPPIIFYLPLVPVYLWLAIRHRGLLAWTAADPAIPNGGGVAGESKTDILRALDDPDGVVLHAERLPADDDLDRRIDRALALIRDTPELGGFPLIMKPDQAQRGMGVWLVRDETQVRKHIELVRADVQLQRYHPGPQEVGVLWSRLPGTGDTIDACRAEIFSITRKTFPVVVGDGEHTLEHLIWRHPRYAMQAKVFLRRHADRLDDVLAEGEELRLAEAGNHAQGAMFSDGADLITPALTEAIGRLVRSMRAPGGAPGAAEGFDFGRLDLRYESEAALKRGEGFAVIELNGTTTESTNLYDPARPVWWAYGVLFRQWARLFALGAMRLQAGARPLTIGGLLKLLREQRRRHKTTTISD